MRLTSTVLLLSTALIRPVLEAQVPGSLDTNFVTLAGTDAFPTALVPIPGGQVYVGGTFTNYGGAGRGGFVRLSPSGAVDPGFTVAPLLKILPPVVINNQVIVPGSTNAGSVTAALVLSDGRPVVAGSFSHLGGRPAPGVAVLHVDGSVAGGPTDVNKIVPKVLLPGPMGTFYVGGQGNVDDTRLPLLRFHPDGARDSGFTPPTLTSLGYLSSATYQLISGPGDTFYVVTAAALPGLSPGFDIVRLTATGALDASFADGGKASIPNPSFGGLAASPSGQLVFNGLATYRGATLDRKINRLALDGSLDPTFNATANPGFGGRVVAVQADGKVLYTGAPNPVNRLKQDGSVDTGYANPAKVPVAQTMLSLTWFAPAPDQSLFAGGFMLGANFAQVFGTFHIFGDPQSAPVIATQPVAQTNTLGARTRFSVTAQGAPPLSYQWFRNGVPIAGATAFDLVVPTTTAADAADYHCTASNAQGSVDSAAVHLTLLEATPGSVFRETDVPTGPDGAVSDLRFDLQGRLLGTGGFARWNQTNRVRVARLLPGDALVDPSFDTSGLNGGLQFFDQVLPLASGHVLATGNLTVTYHGRPHTEVLRLDANGTLDTAFNPEGTSGAGNTGNLDARPTEGPDGKVVLYGEQWNGENLGGSYFRLNPSGTRDPGFALRGGSYLPYGPAAVALADGRYLVAARPAGASLPVVTSGVLRLLADGTVDPGFFTGALPDAFQNYGVEDLRVQADGRILVGGSFAVGSGLDVVTVGVIRLLPDGRPDPGFNAAPRLAALGVPGVGRVHRLALQADGRIVAVGSALGGGFPRNQLFRFWPSGPMDPAFDVGINPIQTGAPALLALAVDRHNALFVGGDFQEFAGLPRTNFARINGGSLQPPPAPPTIARFPRRVVAPAGTNLVLTVEPAGSGPFQFQWRRNEAPGSTNFHDLVGATNASLTLPDLQVADSGLLEVAVVNPGGAIFTPYLTLLVESNPPVAGRQDRSLVAPVFEGNLVGLYQLSAVNPDGTLYAAVGDRVVRLFEDGSQDFSFQAEPLAREDNFTANGISAVLRQPDGKLLVAGRLAFDGGPCNVPGATCFEPKRGLVRLLPDGSLDPEFVQTNAFSGGAQNVPQVLGLQSDGKILVGGTFDNFAGRPAYGLVRLLPTGEFDGTFPHTAIEAVLNNPPRTLPGTVVALHVLPDDRLFVGGGFSRVQGIVRQGVARLGPDGALDAAFVPPTTGAVAAGTSGSLQFHQMGPVTPTGGVYIFGEFQPAGQSRRTALRLRTDGTTDEAFRLATDYQINTGVVQADGKLIINGQFTRVNDVPFGNLARVNLDGSLDTAFESSNTGGGAGGQLTLLPDGKLLAGQRRYFTAGGTGATPAALAFTLRPGGLELTWPVGFSLQRTSSLLPATWSDVAAAPPYAVPLVGPGEFYRLVQR